MKILLVEDNPIILQTYPVIISRRCQGYEVTTAASLEKARQALADSKFDAAVLDGGLPDGRGLELAPELNGMKVVYIPGCLTPEDREIAANYGMAIVLKPVNIDELVHHLGG